MEDPPPEAANGAQPAEATAGPPSNPSNPSSHPDPSDPSDPTNTSAVRTAGDGVANPLSKNQQKKLRRQQLWESRLDSRRALRKEKRIEQRTRKRDAHAAAVAEATSAGLDPRSVRAPERPPAVQVPVSFIIDCSFDGYMVDKEIKSLSGQIMRSYSENRNSRCRAHLVVGSWGGRLRERFELGMNATHKYWKGIEFVEGTLADATARCREVMAGPEGGKVTDVLGYDGSEPAIRAEDSDGLPRPEPEEVAQRDVVYLSSESPYLLDRLEPGTSYVVGGLVDKNREKGLCYRLAREHGVRTAKLPIAEYMVLQSRQVLATNHVVEIMLRWLECGDWGEAFMKAIPKRKGGHLRDAASGAGSVDPEGDDDEEEDYGEEAAAAAAEENRPVGDGDAMQGVEEIMPAGDGGQVKEVKESTSTELPRQGEADE